MSLDKFDSFESGRLYAWEGEIGQTLSTAIPKPESWIIRCYSAVPSTMDIAHALLPETSSEKPGLVIAQAQLKGRGRQGRSWDSPDEGFYGTYCFSSAEPLERFLCLPLVVGLVISETLADLDCSTFVKWPNDILSSNGKKLCGILIELVKSKTHNSFLVGIGLNLQGEPSSQSRATSVFSETGRRYSAPSIASILSPKLNEAFGTVAKDGFKPFKDLWLSKTKGLNDRFSVHIGNEIVNGFFRGVSDLGYLQLEVNGEIRELPSGELLIDRSN